MEQSQFIAYGLVALIAIAGLAGLGYYIYNQSTREEKEGTIQLGATVSLTGKYSIEGQRVLRGYQMAIEKINSEGGITIGDTRYNFSLTYYDDQSDKTLAAQLYDQLITQDKVNILLGPYSSSIVLSVAPTAEQNKIPFIQAGGASDSIYEQGYNYVFGLYRVASTYTEPLWEYLQTSGHIDDVSNVAVFLEDSSFPNAVWAGAEAKINSLGLNLVSLYKYTSGELTSITSSMSDLKTKGGADIILAIGHYADSKQVVQDAKAQGLSPKIIFGTVGVAEPSFVSELGDTAEHVSGFAQWVTNIPEAEAPGITEFVSSYNTKYGEDPAYHAAGGFAAIYVVKAAIEQAGTFTDGDKVRQALTELDIKTIWGEVKFSSSGVIEGPGYMVQIQNGKIETCYPSAYETKPFVFPMNP